ncbi:MAG TPA: cytochrome c biogenesis protein ResB [Luteolibacter sp.]|nr:cytochrome c biogenesis protein ResB [Luteolibacter sp.]
MESTTADTAAKRPRSLAGRIFDVLSGFGLATILLLLMGVLTWFATLEQVEVGLYPTLNKYFHWQSFFLLPELKGKVVPLPLPGGYWVGVVLLVNLTLGGVIRIRKGWKHVGNLIAHAGIIFMLVAGGVAHHFSERGNMAVGEGDSSNTAEDYFEYVVEVAEVADGKPRDIHVIRGKHLTDLTAGNNRLFRFPELPFDLEIGGYLKNALPVAISERAPAAGELVTDGYYLMSRPDEINAEANTAACYARVVDRDGAKSEPFILAGASFHPFTVERDGRVFIVDMRKRLWPMPFTVQLDEFTAEFHPGTNRPAKFVSKITRVENDSEAEVTIQMNEPMRYEGLTFFQASYGPPGAGPGERMYSVFEIVKNPADKWPEYSLYVVTFGMLVTFLTKFGIYLSAGSRRKKP